MLKIKKYFKILLVVLLLMSNESFGQGGPPFGGGGPGQGGPPPPPDNYCQQFPDAPECQNVAVPIGSTESMVIFMFLSGIFFIYKMNGNSFKFKKS